MSDSKHLTFNPNRAMNEDELGLSQRHLWLFANHFYANKAVEQALLDAQNIHDADVCLLLFLVWFCCDGDPCARNSTKASDYIDVSRLIVELDVWRSELIQPLRVLRKNLKKCLPSDTDSLNAAPFIASIKQLELEAEKVQLDYLAEFNVKPKDYWQGIHDAKAVMIKVEPLKALLGNYKGSAVADMVLQFQDDAVNAYIDSAKELIQSKKAD